MALDEMEGKIEKFAKEGYDQGQLKEIRLGYENGVDMEPYLSKEYVGASLAEIRKGLEAGIDVAVYAKIDYNWHQMKEIRIGILNRVDVDKYISHLYSWDQMREIRIGLQQGLDVEEYCKMRYPAGEMKRKRIAILENIKREQIEEQARQVQLADFKIEFLAGAMEAYLTVLTKDMVITKERLLEILKQGNVQMGIQEDKVEEIVEGKYGKDPVLIAKGKLPRKGDDGYYEYFFRTDVEKKPKVLKDGSVNYQDVEWFETVKKDQKLAYYHRAKEGVDGYNVMGVEIKARRGFEESMLVGKGFVLAPDKQTYLAAEDGMIKLDGNVLEVTKYLELDEITMATGNIDFDGSIHIRGNVENGTAVRATEDIIVDGNVGAATIECGGHVVLKNGMNAAGHGIIKAEKGITSRFFETVKVESEGDIQVNNSLNSQIYTKGIISSSLTISGGTAYAAGGFKLYNAGNRAGLHTLLRLGCDEKVLREKKEVEDSIAEINREIQLLNHSYEDMKAKYPPEARNTVEMFAKIENALFTKQKQLKELNEMKENFEIHINRANNAKVVINGQAFEGTVVEMSGCRWNARNQTNITLKRLDIQMGALQSK